MRTLPPESGLSDQPSESGLFSAKTMGAADRKQLEETFAALVKSGEGETLRQYKERIAAAPAEEDLLAGFLTALLAEKGEGA